MDCATQQVFDDRQYRCLGQWKEGNFLYTYTQRTDASAHECFVGFLVSSHEVYIIEAGEHCDRKLDPVRYGMKLLRNGKFWLFFRFECGEKRLNRKYLFFYKI